MTIEDDESPRRTEESLTSTRHYGRKPAIRPQSFPRHMKPLRELLESDIGLDIIEESLILAVSTEPEWQPNPADPDELPPPPSKLKRLLLSMQEKTIAIADKQKSITQRMAECSVSWIEIMALVNKRTVAMALLKSSMRIGNVLDALEEAAADGEIPCRRCSGEGVIMGDADPSADEGEEPIELTEVCPDCMGSKVQRRPGSIDAQKLFLQVHGVGGAAKGGGAGASAPQNVVNIGVQQKTTVGARDGKTEEITTRVQRIIEGNE